MLGVWVMLHHCIYDGLARACKAPVSILEQDLNLV